jgi:HAMP domain-containing protein
MVVPVDALSAEELSEDGRLLFLEQLPPDAESIVVHRIEGPWAPRLFFREGLTAPLRSLTAAAGQMSEGHLSIRAPVRGRDEIGQLARQFDHMAEQLKASFASWASSTFTDV